MMRLMSQSDDMLNFESALPLALFALAIVIYYRWTIYDMDRDDEPLQSALHVPLIGVAYGKAGEKETDIVRQRSDIQFNETLRFITDRGSQILIAPNTDSSCASCSPFCLERLLMEPGVAPTDEPSDGAQPIIRRRIASGG
jgi:hypothetical protein